MHADRALQLLAAVSWLLCAHAGQAGKAQAFCRLTTAMPVAGATCSDSGKPLVWSRQCISYSVVPRSKTSPSTAQIRDVVDRAFASWRDIQCDNKVIPISLAQSNDLSMCDRAQYNETEPNSNSIIFVTDWAARSLPPEAFGLTLVWHDSKSGEIVDADMQLNESIGPLTICGGSCSPGNVDMQNIITHEAGHFLGLGHSSQVSACMYGKAFVGETSKRFLTRDDQAGLCALYGSRAAAKCVADDYVPDNGFSSQCSIVPVANDCGCHTVGAGTSTARAAVASCALLMGAWLTRRRRRGARRH